MQFIADKLLPNYTKPHNEILDLLLRVLVLKQNKKSHQCGTLYLVGAEELESPTSSTSRKRY